MTLTPQPQLPDYYEKQRECVLFTNSPTRQLSFLNRFGPGVVCQNQPGPLGVFLGVWMFRGPPHGDSFLERFGRGAAHQNPGDFPVGLEVPGTPTRKCTTQFTCG